jgi:hypothetical protein
MNAKRVVKATLGAAGIVVGGAVALGGLALSTILDGRLALVPIAIAFGGVFVLARCWHRANLAIDAQAAAEAVETAPLPVPAAPPRPALPVDVDVAFWSLAARAGLWPIVNPRNESGTTNDRKEVPE